MQAEEKELLIQLITRKVLQRLPEFSSKPAVAVDSTAPLLKSISLPNHLISLQEVKALAGQDIRLLLIPEQALVTAAATDLLKELGITLHRQTPAPARNSAGPAGSGSVAVLAPALLQFQWQPIQQAVLRCNYSVEKIVGRTGKVMDAIPELIKGVVSGRFRCGIVLDESAPSLLSATRRLEKIQPLVGWDMAGIKMKPAPQSANLLLMNHRLFGSKKLGEMISAWLTATE